MQKFAGYVVDEDDFKHEVWIEQGPDLETSHVFIMYGGSQITDFSYDQPNHECELSEAAQLVAEAPLVTTISLPILVMTA